jgi:hypothetical protein
MMNITKHREGFNWFNASTPEEIAKQIIGMVEMSWTTNQSWR